MRYSRALLVNTIAFFCLIFLESSCDNIIYTPKPRTYPRVTFPEKSYQAYTNGDCPFTFNYPKYARIERDSLFFEEKAPSDCWFNIIVPDLNAVIYCSYYQIDKKNNFEKLNNDAFSLAGKHTTKADFIDQLPIKKPNKVSGYVFNIEGPAASPFQFYLTDSTHHFLRGALYFKSEAKPDSLKPMIEFMKTDIIEMINTFAWKK